MPLIRIKSLPFAQTAKVTETVTTLSRVVSDAADVPLHHIMITWEYFPAGHYAHHGKVVDSQPEASHPLLVDLIAPNFNTEAQSAAMLELIAQTIAAQVPIEKNNIFINFTPAYSDGVYDEGHVVEWDL